MSTHDDTVTALSLCLAAGEPVVLWGPPGCGKTAVVEALSGVNGWACETVIASVREPSDFAGLPVVGGDGSVRLAPPAWAERIIGADGGVVFFDEITTAPPSVQAASAAPAHRPMGRRRPAARGHPLRPGRKPAGDRGRRLGAVRAAGEPDGAPRVVTAR